MSFLLKKSEKHRDQAKFSDYKSGQYPIKFNLKNKCILLIKRAAAKKKGWIL